MKRKEYIKPEISVIQLESQQILAGSEIIGTTVGGKADGTATLSLDDEEDDGGRFPCVW